jgi:EF hand
MTRQIGPRHFICLVIQRADSLVVYLSFPVMPKDSNTSRTSSRRRRLIDISLFTAALVSLAGCAGSTAITSVRPVPITHDDFALADSNHDGKLSRSEADLYLVFVVFTSSDSDTDGRLSAQEWARDEPAQLAAFQKCDANGDGMVTLSEAVAYTHHDQVALALIRQADRNRDGKLSRAEIDAYFLRVSGMRD